MKCEKCTPSARRLREKRAAAKANGVCTRCFSNPAMVGRSTCARCMVERRRHYSAQNERRNVQRMHARNALRCTDCLAPLEDTSIRRCAPCRERRQSYRKTTASKGLCVQCREPRVEDSSRCARHQKRYADRQRVKRVLAKTIGLCTRCFVPNPGPGTRCADCARSENERNPSRLAAGVSLWNQNPARRREGYSYWHPEPERPNPWRSTGPPLL